MKKTSVIGYPRIGASRELKKWTEAYFRCELEKQELLQNAAELRKRQWRKQHDMGVDFIPSNDFSFYDSMLDTAVLFGAVPKRFRDLGLDALDTYFAMAKGYQGSHGDVHALPMQKWFNTNYHYIVPEIEDDTCFSCGSEKPFAEFEESKAAAIPTRPVLIGPFTFLRLAENRSGKSLRVLAGELLPVLHEILLRLTELGAEWVQIDEPCLVTDLAEEDLALFRILYNDLLAMPNRPRILLQTYFGDVRDSYTMLVDMDFDALGLDFIEGVENLHLLEQYGFPQGKILVAGVVNGKNIWVNHYEQTLSLIHQIAHVVESDRLVLGSSCSLLHVPYTVQNESGIPDAYREHLAFAEEKLMELAELGRLSDDSAWETNPAFLHNRAILTRKQDAAFRFDDVRAAVSRLKGEDFTRYPSFEERRTVQKAALKLPLLPTTTIGSFPQTSEVRTLRRDFKSGRITEETYHAAIRKKIADVIALQEKIGLDVLVHGEFERNDMVEYFGEKLDGFLFTKNAWVQSYGTRCVKPPIIFGDVRRSAPMTVDTTAYAQSLTSRPVKGMLTGPVTILNWSFPREDLPRREIAFQIALAIKAEVQDLEQAGIRIIQIDEAALREKLPLRRRDWHAQYLDWAIPAFRLVHASVKAETQIHTHMCYSRFEDIIRDIDDMDADVITFESAKSDLSLLDVLKESRFKTEVGPGVYDIHSPRVPDQAEFEKIIRRLITKLDIQRLWINPDCGLKTRGMEETIPSLQNMVCAAEKCRK
ncbi:5-methyltetrahydropteroyltriglutamate--homocysteine S-methyltransferase [Ethanoligenens sp.]|uniref:5-methyltetrahydropteroyltriglutamate-- homocysteine S-methyltransferase n=1 Tax=Ethanoligenens sp. TaxID=2099655 RepID=UPI0039EA1CF2